MTLPIRPAATTAVLLPISPQQLGLILQVPVLLLIGFILLIFNAIWTFQPFIATFSQTVPSLLLFAAYPLGIVIHEWLHGLGFALFGGADWREIRYGVYRLTAFCQCDAPVLAPGFRAAISLPGAILGVLPLVAGLVSGSGWLTLFAALMLTAALGDALILWTLRTVSAKSYIMYRPTTARYEITTPQV